MAIMPATIQDMKPKLSLFILPILGLSLLLGPTAYAEEIIAKPDQPAVPIKRVTPQLPRELQGREATVSVLVLVDSDGRVLSAEVRKSTGPDYNEAAIKAVQDWVFQPAQHGGQAVKTRVLIPIRFS